MRNLRIPIRLIYKNSSESVTHSEFGIGFQISKFSESEYELIFQFSKKLEIFPMPQI